MMLEILKSKTSSGWSDTSFLALLEMLTKVLPKQNGLPSSTYQAKKIICLLTLGIKNPYLPEPLHLIPKRTQIQRYVSKVQC
jgi:hypothetical protein